MCLSDLYTQECVKYFFASLKRAKVDGVIVSIPELIGMAIKHGLEAVASSICGIYNSEIAEFYRDLGATRLILPRELSLDDIAEIKSAVPDVEYEVFLMRNGCLFSDSYCLGLHARQRGAFCYDFRRLYC